MEIKNIKLLVTVAVLCIAQNMSAFNATKLGQELKKHPKTAVALGTILITGLGASLLKKHDIEKYEAIKEKASKLAVGTIVGTIMAGLSPYALLIKVKSVLGLHKLPTDEEFESLKRKNEQHNEGNQQS